MKKILKWVGGGLGGLIALVVILVVVKFYVLSPKSRPPQDVHAPTTPEAIARGEYLANHVSPCLGCHSKVDEAIPGEPPMEGMLGAGRDFGAPPDAMIQPRAPNLTPDKDTGLGNWTDGELLRAMREGIGKDGRTLFPMMPYLVYKDDLSDDDALAIIAYLRTLKPVKNDPGRTVMKFPVSMFLRSVPEPVTKAAPPPPPASDVNARGDWLLRVALCSECHDTVNDDHDKIPGKRLAGGQAFHFSKGVVYSSNITPDPATGIGSYSDEDILNVLDTGKTKSGRQLYIMPYYYYKGMTADDKKALVAALRRVPAVNNAVHAPEVH